MNRRVYFTEITDAKNKVQRKWYNLKMDAIIDLTSKKLPDGAVAKLYVVDGKSKTKELPIEL